MNSRIPIYKPIIGDNEIEYVNECLTDSWISSKGKYIKKFEENVGKYINAKYCTTTSNGTTALHLALLALGIKDGDEIITSNFTYVASTNAILIMGAKPVFCEINRTDLNINTELIEGKITSKTRAILVTNVFGNLVDFNPIYEICSKFNLKLIEDAAESFGATYYKKKSGNLADISTFSFFGNKTITTGEGGMIICKKLKDYKKINQLKNQGNSISKTYFHDILGYNYRMTNIQAAIGCAQLERIDDILIQKKEIFNYYRNNLSNKVSFLNHLKNSKPSYWMVPIIFKTINEKNKVEKILNKNNIETRPFFTPIDLLPFYEKSDCRIAKSIYKKGLLLPSHPLLSKGELEKICLLINNTLK